MMEMIGCNEIMTMMTFRVALCISTYILQFLSAGLTHSCLPTENTSFHSRSPDIPGTQDGSHLTNRALMISIVAFIDQESSYS